MPHFIGDILVADWREIVPRFIPSYDALKMRILRAEGKPYGIKRIVRGGGTGVTLKVEFDSLPKKWQLALGDPRIPQNAIEVFYKADPKALEYYTQFTYPDGTYLVDETIDKLIINASMLMALVKLEPAREAERVSKKGSLRGILKSLHADAMEFNKILEVREEPTHSLNTNYRYFKKQFNAFKQGLLDESNENAHYKSLIKDAEGKSKRNALKINEQTAELLNNIFAGQEHKPNATEAAVIYQAFIDGEMEIVNKNTGELYIAREFKPLSISAITNYLSTYESKIGTYAKRSGDRQKLMQQFNPYESMEQPFYAGSMISIDDRQPPFWYDKGKRMWWYLGIDLASEAIISWAYGKTKEELILNFYKQMVRNYHDWGVQLPDALECESSLNSSFKDTFLKPGAMFQNVQIHPNSARSKRIEAYFKPLRYGIEKKQEGWIARPFAKSESNQAQSAGPNKIIPYDRLKEQCFKNIITWNNMLCSNDGNTSKKSRFDYFKSMQNNELKPTNYKAFMKHLGTKRKTSCNAGIMQLQESEWLLGDNGSISTGEDLIRLLKQVEGKTIDVYWLDGNQGQVIKALIYDKHGRYICEALPKPIAARAPIEAKQHHKDAREIMARYRNTVTQYMQVQKNAIDTVHIIDNRKTTVSNSFSIAGFEAYEPQPNNEEIIEQPSEETIPTKKSKTGLEAAFGI